VDKVVGRPHPLESRREGVRIEKVGVDDSRLALSTRQRTAKPLSSRA
jgi:hypothetical protein